SACPGVLVRGLDVESQVFRDRASQTLRAVPAEPIREQGGSLTTECPDVLARGPGAARVASRDTISPHPRSVLPSGCSRPRGSRTSGCPASLAQEPGAGRPRPGPAATLLANRAPSCRTRLP